MTAALNNSTATPANGTSGPTVEVNIPLDNVVDAIQNFQGNLSELLTEVLKTFLYDPFLALIQVLGKLLVHVMVSYPNVTRWQVRQLHAEIFKLELLLATPVLLGIGYIYLTNTALFNYGPEEARTLFPLLISAIAFGAVAPWILDYPVQLSELVTRSLAPASPGFYVSLRLSLELIVITILNAFFLLTLVTIFLIRDFILMWAVVSAPLIALGYVLPFTRKYSKSLIGMFWAFLLIGPLDMITYRLVLLLLHSPGSQVPHWLWAFAGLVAMVGLPFTILSSGITVVGSAIGFIGGASTQAVGKVQQHVTQAQNRNPSDSHRENRFTSEGGQHHYETPEERLSDKNTPRPLWSRNDPSTENRLQKSGDEDKEGDG